MNYKIIKYNLVAFYMVLVLLLLINSARAMRDIPDNYLSMPVLVTTDDGGSATGFYVNHLKRIYFITAKHVLFKEPENILRSKNLTLLSYPIDVNDVGENLFKINLEMLHKKGVVKIHKSQDVVSIFMGKQEGDDGVISFFDGISIISQTKSGIGSHETSKTFKLFNDILVGNEVFIFGYPTSLGIKDVKQIQHDKPLLRKGIVAGKNNDYKNIIIDCPAYPGNSGGPVIEKEQIEIGKWNYRLIGLIAQFVPFEEVWHSKKFGLENRQWQNSGYSIVIPADAIMDLVNE
jgi:hypothetical protein